MQNMPINNLYFVYGAIIVMFGFSCLSVIRLILLDKFGEKFWREAGKKF